MHRFSGGGCIRWQRPRATDWAYPVPKETRQLELCGVPFGLCTWQHLEAMLGHVGALRKIVCNELQSGDPNCICADVEVPVGSVTPVTISLARWWDTSVVLVAALPPPPPRGSCPHTTTTSGAPAPNRSAAATQGSRRLLGAQSLFEAHRLPGVRCLPRDNSPPPPEPSSSTVSPMSALSGHIEASSRLPLP